MANKANKVMLVTGGSRGIGAAIALGAAARGWQVAVNYSQSAERAADIVKSIEAAGGKALAVRCDVSIDAQVTAMFKQVTEQMGAIGALINNAGIDFEGELGDLAVADAERVLGVNTLGPILCCREAVRRMSTKRGGQGGVVINISSISALYGGLPNDVVYAASKGAVDSLTLGLAKEVAAEGIRVCGVRPGLIRTEMFDAGIGPEGLIALGKACVPLGRVGEPVEIANMVCWLCSDEASYVTGTTMNVSGGRETYVRSSAG